MNIMFDSSVLFHADSGGGVYNYLLKLLPEIAKIAEVEKDELSFFHLYSRKEMNIPNALEGKHVVNFRFPVKLLNKFWINFGLPDMSWFYGDMQIFHSPHFSLPVMSRAKKILTVNDITYLKYPEYYTESGRKLNEYGYRRLLPANIKRADRIIAISQHTKNDIMEYFNITDEKISVVYIGCDIPHSLPNEKLERLLENFGLRNSEFIYFPVGTFEPRKNIARTIEAFSRANPLPGRMKLVISGVGERHCLGDFKSSEDVIIVKWNSDDERNALYQGSVFTVYPSLYEGFGMPVVEAMGNRKAVLTSSNSSLGEIAGAYAHTVDPLKVNEIADGMKLLFENCEYRRELEGKSIIRAKFFSWDKMAKETYDIYKSLIDVTS